MRVQRRRLSAVNRAANILARAAEKSNDASLLALSTSMRLDGFEKVKKAINEMIADLKTEQADEVKHKDWCNGELHTNEMDTIATTNTKKDLEAKIDSLTEQIDTLVTDIKNTKAALAQTKVELQSANMDRVEENKAFQATVDEQRATQKLLLKVQDRLNEFYAKKEAAFLQGKDNGKQPVMPVRFDDYKKSAGSSPVITMIGNLITDAKNLESEAITDENNAQTAYEEYVTEANESMAAKARDIVNKSELKATADTELEQAKVDLDATNGELEVLAKYAGDVHKACDFVLKNFDIRQTARGEEIEALGQALAILSGMA
jgi:chromosome segregation ATPase